MGPVADGVEEVHLCWFVGGDIVCDLIIIEMNVWKRNIYVILCWCVCVCVCVINNTEE